MIQQMPFYAIIKKVMLLYILNLVLPCMYIIQFKNRVCISVSQVKMKQYNESKRITFSNPETSKYFLCQQYSMSFSNENDTDPHYDAEKATKKFPSVPEESIVKQEDEHPVKTEIRAEENLEEESSGDLGESEDMDGDGSLD